MNALEYLNAVITRRGAFVPESIAAAVVEAARTLGITISGGMYDDETQTRYLYI